MPIENIRRFWCPLCGFVTENQEQIARIEKLGGRCPACTGGKSKKWEKRIKKEGK